MPTTPHRTPSPPPLCARFARLLAAAWCVLAASGSAACTGEPAARAPAASGPAPPSPPSAGDAGPVETVTVDRDAPRHPRPTTPPAPPAPPKKRILAAHALAVHGCEDERSLRSINGDALVTVEIINRTLETISLHWLDYQGTRVKYMELAPGEGYDQSTFVTHPWVVLDAAERCIGIAVPTASQRGERITVFSR